MAKKRGFVIAIFILVSSLVFAQELEFLNVYTNEGDYMVGIMYEGKNCGQQITDKIVKEQSVGNTIITSNVSLTNGRWECVRKALNKYNTKTGDTFRIYVQTLGDVFATTYIVVCEFTSATQYTYWTIRQQI